VSWIQRTLYGVDLDEEQAKQDQVKAQLAAENEKDREKFGDAWFEEAQANLDKSRINVEAEVDQAFDEGLQEGAANVSAVIRKPFEIVGTGIGAVLKGVPWWVWGIGLAVAGFYLWPVLGPMLGARRRRA